MAALSAQAQKAVVESFGATNDLSAQKYSRDDLNGRKCALVKVQVIAQDVTFQGNVMGDVKEQSGEYWVYMTDGTKQLKVLSRSFTPLMYKFPEPLTGGVTYVLTLTAPQSAAAASSRPKENYFLLKVTPANAHVFVDGTEKPVEDGMVAVALPDGPHTYRVESVGYASQQDNIIMAGKKETRTVELVSTMPTLTITAASPETEIFVNDTRRGSGSWSGELFPDDYVVEGRQAGHRTHSQKVSLKDGQSKTVAIPALGVISGYLNINYKPFDAAITIDGKDYGTTPNIVENLSVGDHSVTISAPGYTPVTLTATVSESTPATLSGSLLKSGSSDSATGAAPLDDVALTSQYKVFQDKATGFYGYKYNDEVVIPATLYETWGFSEGLARFREKQKYGFIDKNGSVVIAPIYADARNFSEGFAAVKIGDRNWLFVDKNGNNVFNKTFDDVSSFHEGMAGVLKHIYDYDLCHFYDYWGFIDKTGNIVINYKYINCGYFSEGVAAVKKAVNKYNAYRMGFIDKAGETVIPFEYDDAENFKNGKALVKDSYGNWFYIYKNNVRVAE